MGKKQHQKDKLYITTTEWREQYGGCKDGEYQCPVTFRVFSNTTHVVAIRQTGNVFSYEVNSTLDKIWKNHQQQLRQILSRAVEELNLKPKNWKDLLSDEPFTRKDIITLQDPHHLDKFNIANFYHVKHKLKIVDDDDDDEAAKNDPTYFIKSLNTETKETLAQLKRDYKPEEKKIEAKPKADAVNAAHYSTGMVAAGFTSTVMEPLTEHEAAIVDEQKLRYDRIKKKGYVRLVTNFGPLNFELHCDIAPKTCENFIQHCRSGYYKETKFHRLIKNFMMQGGDPTGTGTGGKSIWEKPFEDECKNQLTHSGRGILSMANHGPNTNQSQFFITFRSCKHLDRKHTIFGRLVGGFETLNACENVKVDNKDKPTEDIEIVDTQVFVDPYEEADEQLKKERSELQNVNKVDTKTEALKRPAAVQQPKVYKSGVGKYIKPGNSSTSASKNASEEPPSKKSKFVSTGFTNFDSW